MLNRWFKEWSFTTVRNQVCTETFFQAVLTEATWSSGFTNTFINLGIPVGLIPGATFRWVLLIKWPFYCVLLGARVSCSPGWPRIPDPIFQMLDCRNVPTCLSGFTVILLNGWRRVKFCLHKFFNDLASRSGCPINYRLNHIVIYLSHFFNIYFMCMDFCLHVCIHTCTIHVPSVLGGQTRTSDPSETGVKNGCQPLCDC